MLWIYNGNPALKASMSAFPGQALDQERWCLLGYGDVFVLHLVSQPFEDADHPLVLPPGCSVPFHSVVVCLLRPVNDPPLDAGSDSDV